MSAVEVVVMEPDLSPVEARVLTNRIRHEVEAAWEDLVEAYYRRAWAALGYSSWDGYCAIEFDGARLRLPREDRQVVVLSLRERGLSIRAIAAATGDGEGTVRRDLATAPIGAVGPAAIVGVNGKTYPRMSKVGQAAIKVRARELAAAGHSTDQIATQLGYSTAGMAEFLRRHAITVPANVVVTNQRSRSSTKIVAGAVAAVNGIGALFDDIDYSELPAENVQGWLDILTESIRSLTTLRKQLIKETNQP